MFQKNPRPHGIVPLDGVMGVVTVRCPITCEEVSTGVVIDPVGFVVVDFDDHEFRCDACGEIHSWDKQVATYHHESL